jgi:hypothetical protein
VVSSCGSYETIQQKLDTKKIAPRTTVAVLERRTLRFKRARLLQLNLRIGQRVKAPTWQNKT